MASFLARKSLVIPKKILHAIVDTLDESGVINTVTSGAHERLELLAELLGDAHIAVIVLDDAVYIFMDVSTIFFLESEKIYIGFVDHVYYGTIRVTLVYFAGRSGFLFARLPGDELGAAVFPFKGTKISEHSYQPPIMKVNIL